MQKKSFKFGFNKLSCLFILVSMLFNTGLAFSAERELDSFKMRLDTPQGQELLKKLGIRLKILPNEVIVKVLLAKGILRREFYDTEGKPIKKDRFFYDSVHSDNKTERNDDVEKFVEALSTTNLSDFCTSDFPKNYFEAEEAFKLFAAEYHNSDQLYEKLIVEAENITKLGNNSGFESISLPQLAGLLVKLDEFDFKLQEILDAGNRLDIRFEGFLKHLQSNPTEVPTIRLVEHSTNRIQNLISSLGILISEIRERKSKIVTYISDFEAIRKTYIRLGSYLKRQNPPEKNTKNVAAHTESSLQLILAQNTPITMKPTKDFSVGSSLINFQAVNDIKVGNEVVIKAGAMGKGRILQSKRDRHHGANAWLEFSIDWVTAIDGQKVYLNFDVRVDGAGKELIPRNAVEMLNLVSYGAFNPIIKAFKGGRVIVRRHKKFTAKVAEDIEIETSQSGKKEQNFFNW